MLGIVMMEALDITGVPADAYTEQTAHLLYFRSHDAVAVGFIEGARVSR